MAVTSYNCVNNLGERITVNLLETNSLAPDYPYNSLTFASAADAETALGGIFDRNATLIVIRPEDKTFLENFGFTSVINIGLNATTDSPYSLNFSGGRRITCYRYNSRLHMVYSINDNAYNYEYETTSTDNDNNAIHGCIGFVMKNPITFMSAYYRGYTRYGPTSVSALMTPVVRVVSSTPSVFRLSSIGYAGEAPPLNLGDNLSTAYLYPSYPNLVNSVSGYYFSNKAFSYTSYSYSTRATEFNAAKAFFDEFWSIPDAPYVGTVISSVGGTVSPPIFYSAQNEPRAFIVTPDSHHTIYSVAAYNTETNEQIPLQESAMNLETGAKTYMFTMPAANVQIAVEFRSIEASIPVTVKYTSDSGKVYTTSFNLTYDSRN